MHLVGLTGGIGSGKSTVAARLVQLGADLVDADVVAREVVEDGQPALAELVERFGTRILHDDGTLDRAGLAEVAFTDPRARTDLDAITHPRIATRIAEHLAALADPPDGSSPPALAVVDHPLLIETGQTGHFDAVVVVLADAAERERRLVDLRGLPAEDVRARLRAQTDDATRRRAATHVLVNDGDLDELRAQVDGLYDQLLAR